MNTAVLCLLWLCQKHFSTWLSVCVCMFVCVYLCLRVLMCVYVHVCVCVREPPLFRSSEAEGLTSVLSETAAPQHVASANTPAHHSDRVCVWVWVCVYTLCILVEWPFIIQVYDLVFSPL